MKKILILAILAVLASGSAVFAAQMHNEELGAGQPIELTDGVNLPLSPGVYGIYITEGTTGDEQWFGIGTYHSGGNKFYASSSQQTAIWKKDRETGEAFTDAAIPATEDASNSEAQWEAADWAK